MPILTPREKDVATQLMLGRTNKEIADALNISYETVKEHVQHMLRKFKVSSRGLMIIALLREELAAEDLGAIRIAEIEAAATKVETACAELRAILVMRAKPARSRAKLRKSRHTSPSGVPLTRQGSFRTRVVKV